MTRLTIKETAQRLGLSEQAVRIGLQRGLFPFGEAINISGGKRITYLIYDERLRAYMEGKECTLTT